jgi:hypothetical protein
MKQLVVMLLLVERLPRQVQAQSVEATSEFVGSLACECVDPWPISGGASASSVQQQQQQCRNATLGFNHVGGPRTQGAELCLPLEYGRSWCAPWDANVLGECVDQDGGILEGGRPDWCSAMWCYVNASSCQRAHHPSDFTFHDGDAPTGLAYSYETCGNLDTYTAAAHYQTLRGKHLRVSFPGDSDTGYTIYTDQQGVKQGSTVRLMQDIAADVGFTWETHVVSDASRSRFSSAFTACVHEVALGETDMCIGSFWMTSQRLLMASFTRALADNEFKLVVPAEAKDADVLAVLMGPFLPFTASAWMMSAGLVVFMAFALRMIEGDPDGSTTDDGNWMATIQYLARHPATLADTVGEIFCEGLLALTTGMPSQESTSFAGRLVTIGYAVFGLLFLTSFTATTAATMLAGQMQVASLETLDDVLATGGNLCLRSALRSSFVLRYPAFETRIVVGETGEELLDLMDSGQCVAAVIMSDSWDKLIARNPQHCDKILVGASLLNRAFAMPVSDKYVVPMSYLIAKLVTAGTYATYAQEYKAAQIGPPSCDDAGDIEADEEVDSLVMDMYDLASPFLITFCATAIGLVWDFVVERYNDRGVSEVTGDDRDQNFMTVEDRELRRRIRDLPFSELWNRAVATQATEEQLHAAIEVAPKRHLLVRLVFSFECSEQRRQVVKLQGETLMGLRSMAEEMGLDQTVVNSCLDDKRHPKRRLIREVVKFTRASTATKAAGQISDGGDHQAFENPMAQED